MISRPLLLQFLKLLISIGMSFFSKKAVVNTVEKILSRNEEPITTHATLVEIWNSIIPSLRRAGAIIAGGFVSSFINWNDDKIPGDVDVWIPDDTHFTPPPGWFYRRSYYLSSSRTMPPNVKYIIEYTCPSYAIKLQALHTSEVNMLKVVENFDFDACEGIMSPGLDKNGVVISYRATRPEVYHAIMSNTATFLERPWDLDENGMPNSKALDRFRKYAKKGYKMLVHKDSMFTLDFINSLIEEDDKKKTVKIVKSSYDPDEETKKSYSWLSSEIRHLQLFLGIRLFNPIGLVYDVPSDESGKEIDALTTLYESIAETQPITDIKYMTLTQKKDKLSAMKKERQEKLHAVYINQIRLE